MPQVLHSMDTPFDGWRHTFRRGHIVSRDGTDRQIILDLNDEGDLIEVRCIRAPSGYIDDDGELVGVWCDVGEHESNLTRRYEPVDDMFSVDIQFPETTLIACAGKPIFEVIDHPVTRERYGPADVIERTFWDDEAQVSVFEVRRAA